MLLYKSPFGQTGARSTVRRCSCREIFSTLEDICECRGREDQSFCRKQSGCRRGNTEKENKIFELLKKVILSIAIVFIRQKKKTI
jgi:hypothetical protein